MTIKERVLHLLKANADDKFTVGEITKILEQEDKRNGKKRASSLRADVHSAFINPRYKTLNEEKGVKVIEGWPRKFYWTDKTDEEEANEAEANTNRVGRGGDASTSMASLQENDLYPLLSEYLLNERRVYSERIDEARSVNKTGAGGNKWLHPDVVGIESLITDDWSEDIKKIVSESLEKKARLWSFEVKRIINRSNAREVFSQAVFNSSWANFGYLVAAEIQNALQELEMLSSLHGIGVIKLDTDNPSESQIIIPAKGKADVDWATCARVANVNPDFKRYIKSVLSFYKTNEVPTERFWRPKGSGKA